MSKLHIPGPSGYALTACGRQLNNHRSDSRQDASNATIASTAAEYLTALGQGKACRHCGRASGLLPKLVRTAPSLDDGDDE